VTTASDVYTLGILLYEILAGARPYETAGRPLDDVMRLVVDTAPTRPSASADVKELPYDRRRLRGDLDAIVLKAMAKERERRYASAAELADDVDRVLGGKPVLACEPSAAYTLRKLAARHKAVVATASSPRWACSRRSASRCGSGRRPIASARRRNAASRTCVSSRTR
jgi:eukaryotic-like serine/threonine-protein kinase